MSVFSGVKNPTWLIGPDDYYFQEIVQIMIFKELFSILENKVPEPLSSITGYRGFRIQENTHSGNAFTRNVAAGERAELEKLLFKTGLSADSNTAALSYYYLCEELVSVTMGTYSGIITNGYLSTTATNL